MRILLTGTSGQVGGALLPRLRGSHEVRRNRKRWSRRWIGLKPDLINNPAAYTAVDRAEDEAELALRINAAAPAELARWAAARRGAGAFLDRLCLRRYRREPGSHSV
jgi:dTDP-4-dehydrorhamnose reductase